MREKKIKFIVVAGSIMSGLGKGIVTASLGKLLESRGYSAIPIKMDGYLNVDCGTMNPFRHGEVFVLDDGTEVDMDFGTYERFLNISLPGSCSITGGKIFQRIIEKERKGEFLGRDVQIVPHLTDEIKRWVVSVGEQADADVVLVEIGGTVGDLENGYFIESMRQLAFEMDNLIFVQLTYVPSMSPGEQKTKPTQHATRMLQSLGIQPDILITREQEKLTEDSRKKLALYCNVHESAVFDDPLVKSVYELPIELERQGVYEQLALKLGLDPKKEGALAEWKKTVKRINEPKGKALRIAIVGKYTAVKDAYVSVKEALVHSAAALDTGLDIGWVEASDIEKGDARELLKDFDGIIIPGGFGSRGIEGKIKAVEYARINKVPMLGLCLGMQMMVIEWARNVAGLDSANSAEFDKKTPHPVINILPEQQQISRMGGTMRLGAYEAILKKGTIAHKAYKKDSVFERHRHRYEVNPEYVERLKESGLVISGVHPKHEIVEICEWPDSFGVATQAHVELKSRVEEPAPLFVAFMRAAKERKG